MVNLGDNFINQGISSLHFRRRDVWLTILIAFLINIVSVLLTKEFRWVGTIIICISWIGWFISMVYYQKYRHLTNNTYKLD